MNDVQDDAASDVNIAETPATTEPVNRAKVERHRDRRAARLVVFLLLGVYLSTMGGHSYSIDEETYLAGTRALLNGEASISPPSDIDGVITLVPDGKGKLTTSAPIGTLALHIPTYVAGRVVATAFPDADKEEVIRLFFFSAGSFFTAITGGLLVFLARSLGASRRSSVLLALTFGLGTWAWPHSQTGFSEPATAMLLTATLLLSVRWWRSALPRDAALVGLLIGCTALTRSSMLLFIPIVYVAGLIRAPRLNVRDLTTQTVFFALGGLLPAVAFCLNAYIRFGSPVDNGYPALSYATPIYEGVYGLLLSSGKGLFWYAPVCVVALFALRQTYIAQRRFTVVVLTILLTHFAIYGRFEVWTGENSYGPRYLIPLLPLLVALVAPVLDSGKQWIRGLKIAAITGFLVPGLLGSVMYFNAVYWYTHPSVLANIDVTTATTRQQYLAWNFQPRSSPLMLHLRSTPELLRNTGDRIAGEPGGLTPMPAPYEERIHWYARAIEPDIWWTWWAARGNSPFGYGFLAFPIGFLALSVVTCRGLRLRPQPST